MEFKPLGYFSARLTPLALLFGGVVYVVFILSNYLNYGAEGIFLNGLLRLLNGENYISGFDQVPLTLSTYFPTAYLIFYPLAKLLGISEPQALAYYVRVLNPMIFTFYLFIMAKLIPRCSDKKWGRDFVVLGLVFFILKEFNAFLIFKPDGHAMFVELIGALLFLIYLREENIKLLVLGSVLLALAALIKLNVVGLGIGLVLGLSLCGRFFAFSVASAVGLVVLGLGVFIVKLWLGANLFTSLLETTGSDMLSFKSVPVVVDRTIFRILIPYFILIYLAIQSVLKGNAWNAHQKRVLLLTFFTSFFLALFGQFKVGAAINYFYEFIFLTLLVSGFAFQNVLKEEGRVFVTGVLKVFVVLSMVQLSLFPLQVLFNDLKNYDFKAMNQYLDENFEEARVYTENNNAAVHLGARAQTAVGLFSFIKATDSIRERIPQFNQMLQEKELNAIVVVTSNCQNFTPDSRFQPVLGHLNSLVYQKNKICIFAEEKNP